MKIDTLVEKQRAFFATGKTRKLSFRMSALKALKRTIKKYENEICEAVYKDLGKSATESYMCEIGLVLSELSHMIKHLPSYAKDKTVPSPLAQFHSKSFISAEPYGLTLIMSPWNYPFMLSIEPLVGAIAAGNCVIVKPSAYAPETSAIIAKVLRDCFPPQYVAVVEGGREENAQLLEQRFDFIFFTGSVSVGKLVMEKAAKNLTPVCLELGGKSPCIVDKTADIKLAARRIAFGKYLNLGQTCVAPDYLFVHKDVEDRLIAEIIKCIRAQYWFEPLENPDYGKIINKKHFDRILGLMKNGRIRFGGKYNEESLQIEPTIISDITPEDPIMKEEIFGPVLPVMTYEDISEVISFVTRCEKPLALYLFTTNKKVERKVLKYCSFGGGCINDTIMHLASNYMGFGGVGNSGMGCYHGKESFLLFSHRRSIMKKYNWIDMPVRYQPYSKFKNMLLRIFLH